MASFQGCLNSHNKVVSKLARSTGCRTANTLPAPRVACRVPSRPAVRPVTLDLVRANSELAQIHFDARWQAIPAGALELLRHAR